jgi:diaminopimelate decarboxylase
LDIFMEPGRWISTPAMHVLLKVVDKKEATVVIADGGINLLGWERPLFEFTPVLNLTRPSLREFPVRVFGNLCTPLDIWGTTVFGEGVENGDILLVPDQGSYTYSLRQSFIKPIARVIRFDGTTLSEAQPETVF